MDAAHAILVQSSVGKDSLVQLHRIVTWAKVGSPLPPHGAVALRSVAGDFPRPPAVFMPNRASCRANSGLVP